MHFFTPSGFVWYVTENVFSLVELIKLKLFLINILLRKSVTAMDLHCRFAIAVLISFVLKIQLIQILFNKDNCCWRTELVNIPEVSLLANLKKVRISATWQWPSVILWGFLQVSFRELVQGTGCRIVTGNAVCSKGTHQITELNPEKEHRSFCIPLSFSNWLFVIIYLWMYLVSSRNQVYFWILM